MLVTKSNNHLILHTVLWVRNLGRARLSNSGLESLLWLQPNIRPGCSLLRTELGWIYKMAQWCGWHLMLGVG